MFKKSSLLLLVAAATFAQISDISGERIRAHVKFLASDLLEGRGVGTRGGEVGHRIHRDAIRLDRRQAGRRQRYLFPASADGGRHH